jgi:hypothetical protein
MPSSTWPLSESLNQVSSQLPALDNIHQLGSGGNSGVDQLDTNEVVKLSADLGEQVTGLWVLSFLM